MASQPREFCNPEASGMPSVFAHDAPSIARAGATFGELLLGVGDGPCMAALLAAPGKHRSLTGDGHFRRHSAVRGAGGTLFRNTQTQRTVGHESRVLRGLL